MNRTVLNLLGAVGAVSIVIALSTPAISSGQASALVRLQSTTPGAAQTGHTNISGTAKAGQFVGGGAGLTGITWASLTGVPGFPTLHATQTWTGANTLNNAGNAFTGSGAGLTGLNASNIASGTLDDARLSSNIGLLAGAQTFTGAKTFSNAGNVFTGNGAGLTNIPWASLTGVPSFPTLGGTQTWTGSNSFAATTAFQASVGIGTSSPITPLHITSPTGIYIGSDATGFTSLALSLTAATNGDASVQAVTQAGSVWGDLLLNPLGGRVGVRTSTPGSELDVNGRITTDNLTMSVGGAANTVLLGGAGGVASWGTVGSARLTSDSGSLAKVTNGEFSISGSTLEGSNGSNIQLFADNTLKVNLLPNSTSGGGHVSAYGPNSLFNVRMTNLANSANHGYMNVYDAAGTQQAGAYVDINGDGIVFGDTKSFVVPDPADARFNIMYACIEGPEAAMYTRGTGQLVDGQAVIDLPDHFLKLANMNTVTVILTPRDDCEGLFYKNVEGQLVVKELRKGRSSASFDWEVKAVRQGKENWAPVRPWDDALPEGDKKEMWNARLKSIEMKKNKGAKQP